MMNKKSNQVLSTISMLIVGTGSTYSLEYTKTWAPYVRPRVQLEFERIDEAHLPIDVRTPIEHLENIRTVLNPPVAELAILFDVSRQAIYKWLAQDSFPEADKLEQITRLSKIADAFNQAGIHRAGALLNMKTFDGYSLFDLLKAGKSYEKHVKELIAEAKVMEAAHQRSGLTQSNAKPTNSWLSSVSIPSFREDV
jgi:hypothetical protein